MGEALAYVALQQDTTMIQHNSTADKSVRSLQVVQPGIPLGRDLYNILRTEYPPMRWLIPDLIPWGFSLLSASPKAGKSWFTTWIALKIATTPPKEGQLPPSVLFISPDDTDEAGIQEKVNILLGGVPLEEGRIEFWFHDVERLDNGLLIQIGEYLILHPECTLVVIDVYNSVKPERTIDDIQRHDHSAMNEIRQFGQRHDVSVVLLNHTTTKPKARFQQGAGSNGMGGGVQSILELEREEFGDTVTLYRRGRRIPDGCFQFSLTDLGLDMELTPLNAPPDEMTPEQVQAESDLAAREREEDERRKRPHVPGPIEQKLLDVLGGGQDWTPKALAEATDARRVTVRKYLRRMLQRGSVTLACGGVYRLPVTPVTPVTPHHEAGNDAPGNHQASQSRVAGVTGVTPQNTPHTTPQHVTVTPSQKPKTLPIQFGEVPPVHTCPTCNKRLWAHVRAAGPDAWLCRKCWPEVTL